MVPSQNGFRRKHCSVHAILDPITSCLDNIQIAKTKKFSAHLFLDIRKAFDSVSHTKLFRKIDHYGIRGGGVATGGIGDYNPLH